MLEFIRDGFLPFGPVLDAEKCADLHCKIAPNIGPHIFLPEDEFRANPVRKGVNPCPGRNILETLDDSFVLSNPEINRALDLILGKWDVLLKKVVVAVPRQWLPSYVATEIAAAPVPNLGAYVKPDYRNITYFRGIDWHQDIIDYPGQNSDFITLYVYLEEVTENDSPLNVLKYSHGLGATVFPHHITHLDHGIFSYSKNENSSGVLTTRETLVGPSGSAYLWHACTIHGTTPKPSGVEKPRISLRYLVAKTARVGDYFTAIDVLNNELLNRGHRLSLDSTRIDLDARGAAVIRANLINEANLCSD